mmetsp:Transcript_150275/g.482932  ORF Transcript_150275/g.482932 Transcript_150275/m.482932 type:complete len:235 (-) Transcript_150275:760-1464(-)
MCCSTEIACSQRPTRSQAPIAARYAAGATASTKPHCANAPGNTSATAWRHAAARAQAKTAVACEMWSAWPAPAPAPPPERAPAPGPLASPRPSKLQSRCTARSHSKALPQPVSANPQVTAVQGTPRCCILESKPNASLAAWLRLHSVNMALYANVPAPFQTSASANTRLASSGRPPPTQAATAEPTMAWLNWTCRLPKDSSNAMASEPLEDRSMALSIVSHTTASGRTSPSCKS